MCVCVFLAVPGIRGSSARIRIHGTAPLTNGSGAGSGSESKSPDSNLFFSKNAKKLIFSPYFLLITCSQAHFFHSWKFNFLLKFLVKIIFWKHYFIKGENPDPDSRGPKTCGSGSRSPTLIFRIMTSFFTVADNTTFCRFFWTRIFCQFFRCGSFEKWTCAFQQYFLLASR